MNDYYTTNTGDMWDKISFNVYGSEIFVANLISANLAYANTAIFGAGVQILCPDIPVSQSTPLPPWRQ